MQNHFDVTRSKCRQTKPIVWATLLILMSRHADRSSSSLYLGPCNMVVNLQPFVTERDIIRIIDDLYHTGQIDPPSVRRPHCLVKVA